MGYACSDEEVNNSISQSKVGGDISSSIAFRLAKKIGRVAKEVAAEIAANIAIPKFVDKITADEGFVNFYLQRSSFSSETIAYVLGSRQAQGISNMGGNSKVVIEYVSVNPVHPWHVGHLRNALIGDSLSNIYSSCGYRVIRENYLDDLGLQAAEAFWGLMNLDRVGVSMDRKKKFDHILGEIYVKTNKLMETDPKLIDEIRKTNRIMEKEGTAENDALKKMILDYLKAERDTAAAFGIYQDVIVKESDVLHFKLFDRAIEELKRKGIAKLYREGKYAGCIAIDLNDMGTSGELAGLKETVKVLVRSDGTPNYAAKDIAYHMWKLGIIEDNMLFKVFIAKQLNGKPLYISSDEGSRMEFGSADMAVSIIGSQQNFEQQVVKGAIAALGGKADRGIKHLPYEVVELESAKLSGRKGTWIGYTADDLLSEAKARVLKLISESESFNEKERESIAHAVAVSAIKFAFLKVSPEKKIIFSWDAALNFEGDSGPYCQYMYARASRIIEKSGIDHLELIPPMRQIPDEAFTLIKSMAAYSEAVEKACREYRPNVIADYLIDLSTSFSNFYEKVQILKKDGAERLALLSLVFAFRKVQSEALGLLGIEAIERM